MTKLKLILQWSVMLLLIALTVAAAGWCVVWCGDHIILHAATLKRFFSFAAFWLLVFALIRVAWHLGSKYQAQARRCEQMRRVS